MATTEDSQNQTYLKFLIPNKAAGLIIGKSGASIVELQTATGAIIKVNNATAGVAERVLIVAGSVDSIVAALDKVLNALRDAEVDPNNTAATPEEITIKLLIPPASAPVIIGHGGATIKELHTSTGTLIKIGNRQALPNGRRPSVSEEDDRQMIITGSVAKVQGALASILAHINKFARYESEVSLRETLSKTTRQTTAAATPEYPPALYTLHTQIEFYVANEEAGAIIGRNGRRIKELSHKVQASVSRHDEVDTENRRKVTLAGPVAHVHKAHLEVLNWLREHREAANGSQQGSGNNTSAARPAQQAAQQQQQAPQQQAQPMMPGGMNTFTPMTMMPQFQMPTMGVQGGITYHQM